MEGEIVRVMNECWDYLLVLDACRYDYFSDLYRNYFSGELRKGISLGSSTPEWCEESFPDLYSDILYISGNPYINSRREVEGFDAKTHFWKVIDVWDHGWSENLGTVPPWQINRFSMSLSRRYPYKRLIIHYLQPHEPYLSEKFSVGDPSEDRRYHDGLAWAKGYWRKRPFDKLLRLLFVNTGFMKNTWEAREILGLPPFQPMDAVRRRYGITGLREAYRENLRIVLGYAREFCGRILSLSPSKKILITSDHGELLGEGGNYCHRQGSSDPSLLQIPLLEVTGVVGGHPATEVDTVEPLTRSEMGDTEERLRTLGYFD